MATDVEKLIEQSASDFAIVNALENPTAFAAETEKHIIEASNGYSVLLSSGGVDAETIEALCKDFRLRLAGAMLARVRAATNRLLSEMKSSGVN